MDALTDLDRRLRRVCEIPVAAILHSYLYLVARRLAHRMLDAVARKPASDRARNSRQNTTASSADLISQQPASDGTAHGSKPGRLLRFLDRVDGDNLPGIRVSCYRPWSG